MARYLYVIDLQPEFVKDRYGQKVYERCVNYVNKEGHNYDGVLAAVYRNEDNINMHRLVGWDECKSVEPLKFVADWVVYHSGYSIRDYSNLKPHDTVDVIGFDTDACVLCTCFDLFNQGCNLHIIVDGCWSSRGKKMHEAGLVIMRRQFKKAVDEKSRI